MKPSRLLLVAIVATASPALLAAQERAPRCMLLGQMAVSSWLNLLDSLGSDDTAQSDTDLMRLDRLSASYQRVGCDMPALGAAMDCVLQKAGEARSRDVARTCMIEAGLTR